MKKHLLAFLAMLVSSIGLASAQGTPIQDIDLTAETFNLSASYSDGSTTSTKTKVTYSARGAKQSDNIQINPKKKTSGVVSTANPSNLIIEKVVVSATDMSKLQVTMGNTANTYVQGSGVTSNPDNDVISGVISGTNGTYTPTKNYKFFCVMPTGVTQIQKIQVYYKNGDTESTVGNVVTTPAAVNEDITVTSGSVITFSAENADNLAFEVYGQPKVTKNNPYEYIATTDAIVTVTPMQEGKELTDKAAMFYINIKAVEPSENEEWTLVTDANQLSANATYIIAATNGSSSYGLATIAKSTRMDYVETTVTDDVIIDPESDLMRLKLEIDNSGTTPKYYWKTLNYAGGEQGYVSGSGPDDKNKYNTDLKVLEANTYALTTVAVSNKNATITFTNNNSRVLAINLTSNNNYSFGCYASSKLGTSSYPYPRIYTNAGATRPVWRTTANGDVEILSTKGELHVMVFDEDGNQINNDGSKARALATDATWTNKVKEAGEIHTISKPAAGEGKILIQAKEVYNGIHSKEVKFSLASDGTTTGITAVEAEDADAPVEYYNMQGVRVQNPGQGLYIRRQGNRVEKVALR